MGMLEVVVADVVDLGDSRFRVRVRCEKLAHVSTLPLSLYPISVSVSVSVCAGPLGPSLSSIMDRAYLLRTCLNIPGSH